MKKTVYTKAGQVGLVEVERPQSKRRMMLFSASSAHVSVDPISGATVIQILKQGIKIVAMKLLGLSKKSEKPLQRSNQETLLSRLSPMVVGSVMLVVLAMMGRVTVISAPTGLMGCKRSTSVSTLLIGPLSKFQGNHQIIQKPCSNLS